MTFPSGCSCAECDGVMQPPYEPGPCAVPNPERSGERCGEFEGHDGDHGNWFTPPIAPI